MLSLIGILAGLVRVNKKALLSDLNAVPETEAHATEAYAPNM